MTGAGPAITPIVGAGSAAERRGGLVAWVLVALILGGAVGIACGLSRLTLAGLIVAAPLLVALVLRPEWLPVVLVVTVFAEAASFGGLAVSRLMGPVALAIVLLQLGRALHPRFPDRRLLWALIAFSLWNLASALWTVHFGSPLEAGGTAFGLASLALTGMYFVAIATLVRTEHDVMRITVAIWAVAVVMGLIAIAEYAGGAGRALAVSGDANFFASLQIVAVPIGAALSSYVRGPGRRAIVLLGVGVIVGSIFTTLSRGGILALAALFLLLAAQPAHAFFRTRWRKRAFLAVVTVGAAALLAMSFNALAERSSSLFTTQEGGSGRANLWLAAMTGFEERPITGLGFGAFASESNYLMRRTPGVSFEAYRLRSSGQPAHSLYLEALVETGVIGFGLLMVVLAACVQTLRRAARAAIVRGRPFLSAVARACVLALIGFAFASLFLSTVTDRTLWMLFALALALPRVIAAVPEPVPEHT